MSDGNLWRRIFGTAGLAFAASALSLWVFTRNNDFPINYHPDEGGKVNQIVRASQPRNFNQPLLMLEVGNLIRKLSGAGDDVRHTLLAGRLTSAMLAAIAVLALALAGGCSNGIWGMAFVGLTAALCPPLLVYAHYFKEDTALVAGVAIAVAGARALVSTKKGRWQFIFAALLGLGCAAAISSKYVGMVVIVPSLLALCIAPTPKWWLVPTRLLCFMVSLSVAVVVINARAFDTVFPPRLSNVAREHMVAEIAHGHTGHDYLALSVPNTYCIGFSLAELTPQVWAFLTIGAVWFALRRRITRSGVVLAGYLATLVAVLSFDAIPFGRYALPLTVLLYAAAAELACSAISEIKLPTTRNATMAGALLTILLFQGWRCANFTLQFHDDSRQELRDWVARNMPAGVKIAEDGNVVLNGHGDTERFPQQPAMQAQIIDKKLAADAASTVDALAASGVEYVAVADSNYERYLMPGVHGLFPKENDLARRRRFYEELFARGRLVWSSRPTIPTHSFVNPEIRLYRITGTAADMTTEVAR